MIRRPGAVLALFTGLNLLNYLDRYVLAAVLPRVKEELVLSNAVSGVLAAIFLAGYSFTSPIFGALGDRMKRTVLIAIGIFVWSAATVGSGLAGTAAMLLAARAVVGVGEASYATLSPTIIDDTHPDPKKKNRALTIFYAATPIGSALGYVFGGFVGQHWGWRSAFFLAGGPGLALALVSLLVAEPERKLAEAKPDVRRDLGALFRQPLYRKAVVGYCAYTAAVGGFSFWGPEYLVSRFGLTLAKAGGTFGGILVVAGALGTILGGRWANAKLAKVTRSDGTVSDEDLVTVNLSVCATGSLCGAPFALAGFLAPSATIFFACSFVAIVFLFLSTAPINAALLRSVPTELRASAMAVAIFSIHVFGDGPSPPLVGVLADNLPIQLAMMPLPLGIAASAILWWSRKAAARAPSVS